MRTVNDRAYAFLRSVAQNVTAADEPRINMAYRLMAYGHAGVLRDNGKTPYAEHPEAVARLCLNACTSGSEPLVFDDRRDIGRVVTVALLHDLMEDTDLLTVEGLETLFGSCISRDVLSLTRYEEGYDQYLERLLCEGSRSALLVKLCDKVHNLSTLTGCPPEKQRSQVAKARELFLPFLRKVQEYASDARWQPRIAIPCASILQLLSEMKAAQQSDPVT